MWRHVFAILAAAIRANRYFNGKRKVFAHTFELEFKKFISRRLVLQPRLGIKFQVPNVKELGRWTDVIHDDMGLRLRHEIIRKFGPVFASPGANGCWNMLPDGGAGGIVSFATGQRASS